MQCKDIPDAPILTFLAGLKCWGTWFVGYDNSVGQAMPPGTPEKLVRAKMAGMIHKGLVDGCPCGCRGDYKLTEESRNILKGTP